MHCIVPSHRRFIYSSINNPKPQLRKKIFQKTTSFEKAQIRNMVLKIQIFFFKKKKRKKIRVNVNKVFL